MDAGSQQPANAMDVKAAVNDVVMATTLMRCTDKVLSYKISLDQDACRDESYQQWHRARSEESRRRVQETSPATLPLPDCASLG
jgi:hypothetical protein